MTERGLPIVDGAPACPFVAFDDDRDERAASPDHRHRCFAESPPAPRALAHQEAYCLSSAFPVCPTFQDWARREAARARDAEPPPGEDDEEIEPLVIDRAPRRGSPGWNAPPPWLRGEPSGGPGPSAAPGLAAGVSSSVGEEFVAATDRAGDDADNAGEPADGGYAEGVAGGLAGSFADRLASGAPNRGGAGFDDARPASTERAATSWDGEDAADEPPSTSTGATAAGAAAAAAAAPVAPAARAAPPESGSAGPGRGNRGHEHIEPRVNVDDAGAPPWERPRRLEAYPTLRSRNWSGVGISSLVIATIAVLLAAALLIFMPSIAGLGGGAAGPTATPAASSAGSGPPVESAAPTELPAPTATTYEVRPGDTMFRIANQFHVPLQALIDANKVSIPDPDKLKVGDKVIIPAATSSEVPASS